MEVAAGTGTEVVVLDRPNPIDGVSLEGNVVEAGYESFVGAYPLANRHGMTMGEMARFYNARLGLNATLHDVFPSRRFDDTHHRWHVRRDEPANDIGLRRLGIGHARHFS